MTSKEVSCIYFSDLKKTMLSVKIPFLRLKEHGDQIIILLVIINHESLRIYLIIFTSD